MSGDLKIFRHGLLGSYQVSHLFLRRVFRKAQFTRILHKALEGFYLSNI